jgi:adenylate cyclase
VSIFECLDYHDDNSFPNVMDTLAAFGEGLKRYRSRDFEGALHWFEQARKANPEDRPAELYVDRCRMLIAEPPPDDWDGAWVMTEK